MKTRYWIVFIPFLFAFILNLRADVNVQPSSSVVDFKLPFFAESGYKEWEILGHEGKYLGEDQLFVILMTIRIFSGDERLSLETLITSPDANINMRMKSATANSAIRVRSRNYRISGTGWSWLGKENKIIIKSNAKVEFKQSLNVILR